jgi:hypothetical protein
MVFLPQVNTADSTSNIIDSKNLKNSMKDC